MTDCIDTVDVLINWLVIFEVHLLQRFINVNMKAAVGKFVAECRQRELHLNASVSEFVNETSEQFAEHDARIKKLENDFAQLEQKLERQRESEIPAAPMPMTNIPFPEHAIECEMWKYWWNVCCHYAPLRHLLTAAFYHINTMYGKQFFFPATLVPESTPAPWDFNAVPSPLVQHNKTMMVLLNRYIVLNIYRQLPLSKLIMFENNFPTICLGGVEKPFRPKIMGVRYGVYTWTDVLQELYLPTSAGIVHDTLLKERKALISGLVYSRNKYKPSYAMGVTSGISEDYLTVLPAHFWQFLQHAVPQWKRRVYTIIKPRHFSESANHPDGLNEDSTLATQYNVLNIKKMLQLGLLPEFRFKHHICRDLPLTQEYLGTPAMREIYGVNHGNAYCVVGGKVHYQSQVGAATTTAFVSSNILRNFLRDMHTELLQLPIDTSSWLTNVADLLRTYIANLNYNNMPTLMQQ